MAVKSGLMIIILLVLSCRLISQGKDGDIILTRGHITGYVFNYYGLAVSGATVGLEDGPITTSGSDGHYFLKGILEGEHSVGCGKAGYNPAWIIVTVVSGDTTIQDFYLTQPAMVINPLLINQTLNPGEFTNTSLNVLNNGTGILGWQAIVNFTSLPSIPCTYSIALYDTWGDGWNGCSIDVLVNDSVVLNNITLNSGSGPGIFYFNVLSGDQVTTDFNPGPFVNEPYYYIYDSDGAQVWFSPAGNNGPPDIMPGQLIAACTGSEWLTLDYYEGTVPPFGGLDNIPTHLDAAGTISGDVYEAEIIFTSTPFVGEIIVPVTMTILGNEIIAPENLVVELEDDITGQVELSWDWNGEAFQFFVIKRDGMVIATTASQTYTDILNDHGLFCYTVQAVYNEGITSPAGPECIEWPDPVLHIDPDDLQGRVWPGFTVDVFTTINNLGEGTLTYTFPEFAALGLLNDPGIKKNKPGSPVGSYVINVQKDDKRYDGTGYPIVLGAGGPDDFGYIWIDSDEAGGPAFSFTDISTTGTPVFGLDDDNVVGPYNIGFDFYFYGEIKSQFWVNSNGCVGFTSNYITLGNTIIPTNSSVYNDFIAWMWDDMVFRTGTSQVFYQSYPDKLIIQFKNYEHYSQPGLFIDAEVVIFSNGKIKIMYDDFDSGILLNSCTVGIQSSNPGIGLQVAYNTQYLHNDLAILFSVPADFISGVQPANGTVAEGSSEVITITYDPEDYAPGPHTQELLLESNDPGNREYVINNTMHVYLPAKYSGVVIDGDDDEPLNGVLVTAGPYQATSGENGEFTLYVDEGSYDVLFEKLGYMAVTVEDTTALEDIITPINLSMWDMNYAPGFVHAEVMADDTWCEITWSLPDGPYEIIMDDGEADDYFVFTHSGSWHAVKFTPAGYPATIIGGNFYVGDGSFPGPFLGTEFGVAVFDDDGINGVPGTMLDSSGVTVNNSGWVSIDWLEAVVNDGSFYLAMHQSGNVPHAAPIGIDSDNPTHFRSYSKFLANDWTLSPFQDFMIRAWIYGPESDDLAEHINNTWRYVPKVPAGWKQHAMARSGIVPKVRGGYESNSVKYKGVEGKGNRDVVNYRVAHYYNFDVDDPLAGGNFSEFASTSNLYYNDFAWSGYGMGWYAYGVKALYTSGEYSGYTISNIAGHLMDCQVLLNISLTGGLEPVNIDVTLQGLEYPYEIYSTVTPSSGSVSFDPVWKGHYDIILNKIGYDEYRIENTSIQNDRVFNIILSEKKYPPTCLEVDPLTLQATWCKPLRTALKEDFEDLVFPPAGWQSLTASEGFGWIRSNDAGSAGFVIPPWDSYYAVVNNDTAGSVNNGCCDYLVTPPLDLRESEGYALSFDSFYNGDYGQLAFMEYSLDEGMTWEVFYQLIPDTSWSDQELDLAAFSGATGPSHVWFAFHADDAGEYASGWAIDNVRIQVPAPAAGYHNFSVFLDDFFVGLTTETGWDFAPLTYGQTYKASVAANYSSGMSSKDNYTFTSTYLFPPQNLAGIAPDDAAILTWDPPGSDLPFNLLGYNIYRDDIFLEYLLHSGGWNPQGYVEESMQPGNYSYTVTGVYDLEPYGLPGETGESMEEGPEMVTVDYCNELEFIETWELGGFDDNAWISDGANWSVDGQKGNPAPSAEFTWDPVQTDYEISLESYPICAVDLTEGNIWLNFDLTLYSVYPTGEEILLVEVWSWDTQVWTTVAEYSNQDDSFEWISEHIDIRPQAMNKVFKIRFKASGANSADIRSWFVDNIHVYRSCAAPKNLAIDPYYYDGIRLIWELTELGHIEGDEGTRDLVGFNIYRSVDGGGYELKIQQFGVPYAIDPDSTLTVGSFYCYMVSAIWESETDQCESAFSNEACVLWTATAENADKNEPNFNIYPNPANDHVFISSSGIITHVSVYHSSGKQIFSKDAAGRQIELNTTGYSTGAYLVRLETSTGVSTCLLTIQR